MSLDCWLEDQKIREISDNQQLQQKHCQELEEKMQAMQQRMEAIQREAEKASQKKHQEAEEQIQTAKEKMKETDTLLLEGEKLFIDTSDLREAGYESINSQDSGFGSAAESETELINMNWIGNTG